MPELILGRDAEARLCQALACRGSFGNEGLERSYRTQVYRIASVGVGSRSCSGTAKERKDSYPSFRKVG